MLSTILNGKDGRMPLRGWRHGWPGYPRCIPVRQVIILPKQITAFISLNRQMYLEMRLWVTKKDEGVFRKKFTACSIACFVRLWSCEHPECANHHHTPVSRSAWKAVSREAETWKLKTEITGFSLDGTKLGLLAFRCRSGRQNGHATTT